MPTLSMFYGIVIQMFWNDHPPPHFHAVYAGMKAKISIDPVGLIGGQLPPRAMALAIEWAMLHRDELLENWRLRTNAEPLKKIDPLA